MADTSTGSVAFPCRAAFRPGSARDKWRAPQRPRMPIYTGRGDEGMTDLWDMSRVPKTNPRVEAYGTVDELNSLLGTVRPTGYDDVDQQLGAIQNHLFVAQADFANPDRDDGSEDGGDGAGDHGADGAAEFEGDSDGDDASDADGDGALDVSIRQTHVDQLEGWIDDHEAALDQLEAFVLPGGSGPGARLHHARAVCRRAERRAVALADEESINGAALVYLNRLSDALFVIARTVNHREGVTEEHPTY